MSYAQRPRRWFQRIFGTSRAPRAARVATSAPAPRTEPLERRAMLDGSPQGPEFLVNVHTTGNQVSSAVAMDNAGNFVVVWQSANQDGNLNGIYARRYNAAGIALGEEFRVNETTTGDQFTPTVAMDNDGDFVVAWNSFDQGGVNGEVWARRFTNAGAPAGPEFHVNVVTTGGQNAPAAAMDGAGNFVITWHSPGNSYEIYARRYNASGTALAGEFIVNGSTGLNQPGNQINSAVAMDADGDFVVSWQSTGVGTELGNGVFARRFSQAGTPVGDEFKVNQFTTGEQRIPAVAMDILGNFVIAWESNGQDGSSYGVYAKRYTNGGTELTPPAGVPLGLGNEFRVNSQTTDSQRAAAVAMDDSGDFVIAWASRLQDGSLYGVYAKRYNSAGQELALKSGAVPGVGNEFRVNTHTTNQQLNASVAISSDGIFIVSWQSEQQEGVGSGTGIYAQRFGTPPPVTSLFVWQNAPQRIDYVFNQAVAVDPSDIRIRNTVTLVDIPTSNIIVSPGPVTNSVRVTFNYPFGALPDGRYEATLFAAQTVPTLPADDVETFQFLMADSDQNGIVNLQDFNRLAANFGATPRDFTQGDFNYDGSVTLQDFNLLAGRFGATIAPVAVAATRREGDERNRMIDVVG